MGTSVAKVIGGNARALRLGAGVEAEVLAKAATRYGLPYTSGRIGDLEFGRVTPSLPVLFCVAAALSDVIGRPVSLADLLGGSGPVALTDTFSVDVAELRAAVSTGPVAARFAGSGALSFKVTSSEQVLDEFRESDVRLCHNLGVEPGLGAAAMLRLWQRPFSAERDEQAGPGANAQTKGQVSRRLKTQLQEEIQHGNG